MTKSELKKLIKITRTIFNELPLIEYCNELSAGPCLYNDDVPMCNWHKALLELEAFVNKANKKK